MSMEKAFKTCIEMLTQRDYSNIIHDNEEITAIDRTGNITKCIYINEKISTQNVKDIISMMESDKLKHIIIIYEDEITTPAKKIIQGHKESIIEVFDTKELQINITKHRLQPVFELVKKDESLIIKKKMGVKFPIMFENGPISRFFYYKKEDMIRVITKDGYISYRIVK